jgi:hypothetical protein
MLLEQIATLGAEQKANEPHGTSRIRCVSQDCDRVAGLQRDLVRKFDRRDLGI